MIRMESDDIRSKSLKITKINYWMFPIIILLIIFVIAGAWFIWILQNKTNVPTSIFPDQIVKTYSFANIDYALYQKANMNIPIYKSTGKSGILYANKDDHKWKEFTQIRELSNSKNNPFILDYQSGKFFVLVIDANGAGSGEGVAKLLTLTSGAKAWNLESCFYYGGISFDWSATSTTELQKVVNNYLKTYPDKQYSNSAEHCNDFQLIQY